MTSAHMFRVRDDLAVRVDVERVPVALSRLRLAAFFTLVSLAALAITAGAIVWRKRRDRARRDVPLEVVSTDPSAIAAEIRRRALEERPVIRFLDDTVPYASTPSEASVISLALPARRRSGPPEARSYAWAFTSISSFAWTVVVFTLAGGTLTLLDATLPAVVGFGALARYVFVAR